MNQSLLGGELANVMREAIATGLFVSAFTAQSRSTTLGVTGVPNSAWVNIAGLVSVVCMKSFGRGSQETSRTGDVDAKVGPHVLLDSYYPAAVTAWRAGARALVDGVAYNIVGAEHDSQSRMTRVFVELVTT